MITFSALGRLGRFANQIWQISSTIGIAVRHGYNYGFPPWVNYDHAERFGSKENIDVQSHFVNPLPVTNDSLPQFNILSVSDYYENYIPDNVSLWGNLQNPSYFDHCMPLIRHYMTMKNEYEPCDAVAIHVRRGDYDNNYHPLCGADYYMKAIEQMPLGSRFKVFSDDIEAAIAIFGLGQNFEYMTGNDYIEDFRIMKSCKHFICANSSFSLMAAILADQPGKIIVAPRLWFGPAWGSNHVQMSNGIYPAGAVVI